ncbi:MAG: hypothetical protein JW774_05575 [Candidatus Aureabacteria bacterium]|nr:hypothetical protein [Candidatus Auribacterota bacterium]
MLPLISIYIGGSLTLLLAIFHARFYQLFNWEKDLEKITVINHRILYTIHLALLLLFFMIGMLSITYAKELSESAGIAFGFNLFYSIFWIWRLVWQFLYFKKPEGQKTPPTGIFLMVLFVLLIMTYSLPVLYRFL